MCNDVCIHGKSEMGLITILALPADFDGTAFISELLQYVMLVLPAIASISAFILVKRLMKP